jgi:O-acetyl-ADP-ribose deacetylase (regulator of RNase III)
MITLTQGDITQIPVDAIVNAANSALRGGGGVDGAIHRAGGPQILEDCRQIKGGCPTGQAVITTAGRLPAKYLIHTVGPVWHGGLNNEDRLLFLAYWNSLKLAEQKDVRTISFPNISTGVYGFPKERAADIAVRTVRNFQKETSTIENVLFVCFDAENYQIYRRLLEDQE